MRDTVIASYHCATDWSCWWAFVYILKVFVIFPQTIDWRNHVICRLKIISCNFVLAFRFVISFWLFGLKYRFGIMVCDFALAFRFVISFWLFSLSFSFSF